MAIKAEYPPPFAWRMHSKVLQGTLDEEDIQEIAYKWSLSTTNLPQKEEKNNKKLQSLPTHLPH